MKGRYYIIFSLLALILILFPIGAWLFLEGYRQDRRVLRLNVQQLDYQLSQLEYNMQRLARFEGNITQLEAQTDLLTLRASHAWAIFDAMFRCSDAGLDWQQCRPLFRQTLQRLAAETESDK